MTLIKSSLLSFGLLCVSLAGAQAQTAPATNAIPATTNSILLHATAAYEDLVAPGLAKNFKAIAEFLAIADKDAEKVEQVLPAADVQKFQNLRKKMHQAADAKDGRAVALDGMVVYRLLVDHLQAETLRIPREVDLIDYAGYQLQLLAAADHPDWQAIRQVAADADAWWTAIARTKVTNKDKAVRATVTSAMRGTKQAAQEKNLPMLKFAAQMDLDLVDVLEGLFPKTK